MTVSDYIDRHLPRMKYVVSQQAYKYYLNPDDLLQESVIRAIRMQHQYRDDTRGLPGFLSWWYMVVRSICLDEYRKAHTQRTIPKPYSMDAAWHIPTTELGDRHEIASIYLYIGRVFGHRSRLMMYLLGYGYDYQEIAQVLRIPVGTLKGNIHKVRKHLRKEIVSTY